MRQAMRRPQMSFLGESVAAGASLPEAAMRRAPDVPAAPLVSLTLKWVC